MRNGSLDFAVAHVVPEMLDAEFESIELFQVQLTVGMLWGRSDALENPGLPSM